MEPVIGTVLVELLTMIGATGAEVASFIYQAEETTTSQEWFFQPTIGLAAVIVAVGAVAGAVASTVTAIVASRSRVPQELQIEYDKDLRSRRIEYYTKLWSSMRPLAKYPEPGPLPYDDVEPLSISLQRWYFRGGGLFMSPKTRDTYFDLQDGLKIVLQKHKGCWPPTLGLLTFA